MVEALHAEEVVECRVRASRSRRNSSSSRGGSSSSNNSSTRHKDKHHKSRKHSKEETRSQDGQSVATLSSSTVTPACATMITSASGLSYPSVSHSTTMNNNVHTASPHTSYSARNQRRSLGSYEVSHTTTATNTSIQAMAVHVPGEPDGSESKTDSHKHKDRVKRKKVTTILVPVDVDEVLQASQPKAMRTWMQGEAAQQIMHNTKHRNSISSNDDVSDVSVSRLSSSHVSDNNTTTNNNSSVVSSARQSSALHHAAPPAQQQQQVHVVPPQHVVHAVRKTEEGKASTSTNPRPTPEPKLPPLSTSPNTTTPVTVSPRTSVIAVVKDKETESKASAPRKPAVNAPATHDTAAPQAPNKERTASETNNTRQASHAPTSKTSNTSATVTVIQRTQPKPLAAIAGTETTKPSKPTTTSNTTKDASKEDTSTSSKITSRAAQSPRVLSSRLPQPVTAHLSPSPSSARESSRDTTSLPAQTRTTGQPPPPPRPPPPPLPSTHNTSNSSNAALGDSKQHNTTTPKAVSEETSAALRPVPPYMLNKIKTAPSIVHGGLPTLGNTSNSSGGASDHGMLSQGLASAPHSRTMGAANNNTQAVREHVHVMDSGSRLPGSHNRHHNNNDTSNESGEATTFVPVAKTESTPVLTRSSLVFAESTPQQPPPLTPTRNTTNVRVSDATGQKPADRASFATMQDYVITEVARERLRQRHDSAPAAILPTNVATTAVTAALPSPSVNTNQNTSHTKSSEQVSGSSGEAGAKNNTTVTEDLPRVIPAAHSHSTAERHQPTPTPPHLSALRTPPSVSVYRRPSRPRSHSPLMMTAFVTPDDGVDYPERTMKSLPGLTHLPNAAASNSNGTSMSGSGSNDMTNSSAMGNSGTAATELSGTLGGNNSSTSVWSMNGRTPTALMRSTGGAAAAPMMVAPVRSTRRGWTASRFTSLNNNNSCDPSAEGGSLLSNGDVKKDANSSSVEDGNRGWATPSPRRIGAGGQYRRSSSLLVPAPESASILAPTPLTQLPTFIDRSQDTTAHNNTSTSISNGNDDGGEAAHANHDGQTNNSDSSSNDGTSPCGEKGRTKWVSPLAQQQHRNIGRPSYSSSASQHNDNSRRAGGSVVSIVAPSEKEQLVLSQYLHAQELNLSMSTFTCIGSTLVRSHALRVLNLRGCTMSSEGLRGLADIPTLRVICLANMRYLTTLEPLLTPSAGHVCHIEELDAHCTPLKNDGIRVLAQLPHLRRLDLSMTAVSEVGFLAECTTTRQPAILEELAVAVTLVDTAGIAGLEKIATLKTLNISRSRVTSLAALVQSKSIETLLLYSCKVTDEDIAGIEHMPRLSRLDLSTTKVTDLSVLRASRSLRVLKAQWLTLKNCYDIIQERRALLEGFVLPEALLSADELEAGYAGLAEIPTLETLDLSFNTLRSIKSLCASPSLRHLILRRTRVDHNGVAGIAALRATLETLVITNLAELADAEAELNEEESENSSSNVTRHGAEACTASTSSFRTTLLSNITTIATLTRLKRLDLSYTDVYDLRLLRDLSALRELVLVETLVTEDGLRGVEKIATLELLDLSQTSVMSLQFLYGGATALRTLLLKSNRNERGFHLGPVHKLAALVHLDLSDTVVEDAYRLSEEPWQLQSLVWRWGERKEVAGPVPALVPCCVTAAALMGLSRLPDLQRLDLSHTAIASLEFIRDSVSLRQIRLDGCRELNNETLHTLARLPRLEAVSVCGVTNISDVSCLAKAPRLREVYLADTSVTVAGVEAIARLTSLQMLDIAHTKAEETVLNDVVADNNTTNASHIGSAAQDNGRPSSAQMLALACAVKFPIRRRSDSSHFSLDASTSGGLSEFNASSCTSASHSYHDMNGGEGGWRGMSGHRGSYNSSASSNVNVRNSLTSLNGICATFGPAENNNNNSSSTSSPSSGTVKRLNASLLLDGVSAGINGLTAAPMHFRIPRRRRVSFVEEAAAGTPTRHSAAVTLHTRKAM